MPKRNRNASSSNPLSDARRGVRVKYSSGDTDQRSLLIQKKTDSLWHRKSGAGYHLFLQYYGSQPCGVVSRDSDHKGSCVSLSCLGTGIKPVAGAKIGAGMSRAAKKRQKKKTKASHVDSAVAARYTNKTIEKDESAHAVASTLSHPLLQTFASSLSYRHLEPYLQALAAPLPLTLRIRKDKSATFFEKYSDIIAPVSYDPSLSIYQSTKGISKTNLSNNPELKELIVNASMDGTLARQEIGSMLPVIALQHVGAITKGAKVLDLCASPGSKTLQALEVVAQNGKGRLIANDVHAGRLDSLKDAVTRSGFPESLTARVTFTNYDASVFPPPKSGKLFGGIVCDVPCSGDGTIRKDKHILPMWTPSTGNELHGLQLKILNRALELVKIGGVVCYSTCSLNPVEDEAVVAAAMQAANKGELRFELMKWPEGLLPGFILEPGTTEWKVGFYDQNKVDDGEEGNHDFGSVIFAADKIEAEEGGFDANETLWPPKLQIEQLNLDRCVRLLPQDNNTGGFFLVLIKRLN